MPSDSNELSICYNKGCGQRFDPKNNTEDGCVHHPGAPFFHDAYKGWSCCKKKCTDFTEFLNIKGCTRSFHSDVKPEEPQKETIEKSNPNEVIEYKAPVQPEPKPIERPSFSTPMVKLLPKVSDSLRQNMSSPVAKVSKKDGDFDGTGEVPLGTVCKNNGCNRNYVGPETQMTNCIYHPGYPVFHEGLKFWTCCTKRTTDFNSFLEQVGCSIGEHIWHKAKTGNEVKCRFDWHQTGRYVVVSVYAKMYDPDASLIQLSPVRLKICLNFPEEKGNFESDLELRGVVDVDKSSVLMLPTKVEIKLHKVDGSSWSNLDFPKPTQNTQQKKIETVKDAIPQLPSVDLSDI
uniref:CHORD domain-containing protein n=1 Tax=Clastoptera arizonana TaxID=38151 RepID=A0A1B6D9E1_9HEMI